MFQRNFRRLLFWIQFCIQDKISQFALEFGFPWSSHCKIQSKKIFRNFLQCVVVQSSFFLKNTWTMLKKWKLWVWISNRIVHFLETIKALLTPLQMSSFKGQPAICLLYREYRCSFLQPCKMMRSCHVCCYSDFRFFSGTVFRQFCVALFRTFKNATKWMK